MKNKIGLAVALILFTISTQAQQAEMADTMRSEGKIYVVVAIMLVIFVGLILFLMRLDRKLNRLEEQLGKKN